jgi:hypothetical protein
VVRVCFRVRHGSSLAEKWTSVSPCQVGHGGDDEARRGGHAGVLAEPGNAVMRGGHLREGPDVDVSPLTS